ncbi:MAG: hypothetical protein ACWGMZ_04265 [Thermoguttaceae bacterium]
MVRSLAALLVGTLALAWTFSASAQEAVLGQLYGSGVEAYFSGNYIYAYNRLTAAIKAGSRDPRVYYFRGLAYVKLGRKQDAKLDFQKGANLEIKDVNQFYGVPRSLERVQGSVRQLLESYRVRARMIALEKAEKIRKARYESLKREEARVLQRQISAGESQSTGNSAELVPTPTAEPAGMGSPANTNSAASKAESKPLRPRQTPRLKKQGRTSRKRQWRTHLHRKSLLRRLKKKSLSPRIPPAATKTLLPSELKPLPNKAILVS